MQLTWSGRTLDSAALQAWAVPALQALLRERVTHAEVGITPYPLSPSTPLDVPPGRVDYAIRHVQSGLTARMQMLVDVLVDGTVALSVPVWFRLEGSQLAWRVRQEARAGATFEPDMLERARVPVSHQPLATEELQALNSARLRRTKVAGSLLLAEDVERRKAVERGSEIVIRVVRGGIAVEDRALALNEAVQGAPVRVVSPRTQASYLATVIGDGLAEIK